MHHNRRPALPRPRLMLRHLLHERRQVRTVLRETIVGPTGELEMGDHVALASDSAILILLNEEKSHNVCGKWSLVQQFNNKFRELLGDSGGQVHYLGWDDYHFGHSTVRPFQPGRGDSGELGRIGWVAVEVGGTSKSMPTQPRYATTRVTLKINFKLPFSRNFLTTT